jgi:antitoxin MazE
MLVSKWGNSLAVRLPKEVVEKLGIKEGDELTMIAKPDGTIGLSKNARRERALQRFKARAWALPQDYSFDREDANARERDVDDPA